MATAEQFRINLEVNSLEEIEAALTTVHAHRGHDLTLSATGLDKRRGALRDSAFLQLIQTWIRLSPDSTLRLVERTGFDPLEEACGYSVGIGALALAGKVAVGSKNVGRPVALTPATARMDAAYEGRYDELRKGQSVDLICVSGAERQYLKPLFKTAGSAQIKDHKDLKSTVSGLVYAAYPMAQLDDGLLSALATLTHELIENSQEHGTSDERSRPYRRHAESIFVNKLSILDAESQNDLLANATLERYWNELAVIQKGRQHVQGLCFSFLDSGPGLAAKLRGVEYAAMSLEDEATALRECLKLNVGTKEEEGTGSGLVEVLQEVSSLHGFVRIRSGRHAIFRCFTPGDEPGDVFEGFSDWFPDRQLFRVAGTLVSVFIPLPKVVL